jgi:hypothetical protein
MTVNFQLTTNEAAALKAAVVHLPSEREGPTVAPMSSDSEGPPVTIMTRSRLTLAPLLLMSLVACDPSTTSPTGGTTEVVVPPSVFIPDFTFTWQDTANKKHTFIFNTDVFNKATGTITGGSEVLNAVTSQIVSGSFSQRNLTFVVKRAKGNVTFTGTFTDADTISLSGSDGTSTTIVRCKTC